MKGSGRCLFRQPQQIWKLLTFLISFVPYHEKIVGIHSFIHIIWSEKIVHSLVAIFTATFKSSSLS